MNYIKSIFTASICSLLVIFACKKPEAKTEDPTPTPALANMYFKLDTVVRILPRVKSYYNVVQSGNLKTLYYKYNDTTVQIDHKLYNLKEGNYTNMQNSWDSTEVVCQVSNNGSIAYKFIQGTYKIVKENGKFVSIITPNSDFYDTYRWKKGEMRIEWPD